MGYPLAPTLDNVFFCLPRTKNWLELCPLEYRPFYYQSKGFSRSYLGPLSLQTRTKYGKSLRGILNCCKLKIVLRVKTN